ncbi:MAG: ATP-binding cassette domain-containing protein [Burkholderiaceae bacterium]|nr:ATP-binding cassette domain-containing protein [Burkholderiaceae bacterium]
MRSDTRQAIALLHAAARPERRHLMLGVAWLTLAATLEMTAPILTKRLIDNYLLPHRVDLAVIATLLITCLLCNWAATTVRYLQLLRLAGLAMRSVQRLREQVYEHVLHLPMAFFDSAITGKLVSRVTNDTEAVKTLYIQVLFVMLDSGIVIIGAIAAMAWLDLRLMLIVTVLLPAVIVIVWLYQRWSAPAVSRARELRSDINAQMAGSIAGMSVLQASNATPRFGTRFADTNHAHFKARMGELSANAWLLRPALDMLNVVLLVAVIYAFGAHANGGQSQIGGVEAGILYAFVSYIGRVIEPLIQITMQFSQLQQSVVSSARVNALLQEYRPVPVGGEVRVGAGAVAIRDLSFGYKPEAVVLHDLNLSIPAGSFYGVVGHTGSGKSTLLSLLLRFYRAQSGSIEIDGVPLADIGDDAFRAHVGLVPQDPFLLAASARDNIDMGRRLPQREIEAAARAAKAHDFICALEQGYDTPLGEGGARLSTGQKQLIAIARALAGKPRILLLDEATSHIDSETEQVVQNALDELRGKVTIIAIAHRLSTIRDADRIVVLNHGRIAEAGTHDVLMEIGGGIYQRLYMLQQLSE